MKRLKLTTVCCVIVPLVCCAITGFTLFFAIYESLDLWEDIANAVERTYEICGYQADKKAESIMYQTNACDSVVMFEDHRSASAIEEQMRT